MELQIFNYEDVQVRTVMRDGEPWFVAADVCTVLGIGNSRDAMNRLDDDEKDAVGITDTIGREQIATAVNESGLYSLIMTSRKPEAKRFKKWVTSVVLPAIRKTGSYLTAKPTATLSEATKTYRALYSVGRLFMDKNAAAIAANQATIKATSTDLLGMLGATHLVAEKQEIFYTPTEIASQLGLGSGPSAGHKANMLLQAAGLQRKIGADENGRNGKWEPTEEGKKLSRIFDVGKQQKKGAPVMQVKWASSVLSTLGG